MFICFITIKKITYKNKCFPTLASEVSEAVWVSDRRGGGLTGDVWRQHLRCSPGKATGMGKLKGKDELVTTWPRNSLLSGCPFPILPTSGGPYFHSEERCFVEIPRERKGLAWRGEKAASWPAGGQGGWDRGQSPGSTAEIPEEPCAWLKGTLTHRACSQGSENSMSTYCMSNQAGH